MATSIRLVITCVTLTGLLLCSTVYSVAQTNETSIIGTQGTDVINQTTQNSNLDTAVNSSMPSIQNESENFCNPAAQVAIECSSLPPTDPYS
jgi:hypothetical protein